MSNARRFVYRPRHPRTFKELREHLSATSPEEVWSEIENEHGPPRSMTDAALNERLTTELRIAEFLDQGLRVPTAVAERVLLDVIGRLRHEARAAGSVEVKQSIIEANRLLQRWRAGLPRRPKHRPRKSFAERLVMVEAVREFDQRRLLLMRTDRLKLYDAIDAAAKEIAPKYEVSHATLISWWQHPGRWWRRRWRARQV
jgi:hypothetical protein